MRKAPQSLLRLALSHRAERDLLEIYRYLSEISHDALVRVDREIFKKLAHLKSFPESGHWVPEFSGKRYREIRAFHYRIIYRFDKGMKRIWVLTIHHGQRFLPDLSTPPSP